MYHHFGFDDNDLENIRKVDSSFKVYGEKSKDIILEKNNSNSIIRINEINENCNKLVITEGRMPENNNEMLMEDGINNSQGINIGDVLEIEGKQIKIVGSALSTDFLIQNKMLDSRGTSTLGSGKVSFYLYALKDYFDFDYYTTAYVIDEKISNYDLTSNEYKNTLKKDRENLKKVKEELEKQKHQKIIDEANKKIDDEEAKANSEIENAKTELDNAEAELANGKEKLDNTKSTLESSKTELDNAETKIKEYEEKLNSAKSELDTGKQKLADTKKTLDDSKDKLDKSENQLKNYDQELNSSKAELDKAKAAVTNELAKYNITYEDVLESINKFESKGESIESLTNQIKMQNIDDNFVQQLTNYVDEILKIEDEYTKIEIDNIETKIKGFEEILNSAKAELDNEKQKLDDTKKTLDASKEKLDKSEAKITSDEQELNSLKSELDSLKEYVINELAKYNKAYDDILECINKYQEKVIEFLTNNIDDASVEQITEVIENIQKIEEGYTKIEAGKIELDKQKQTLATGKEEYNSGLKQYNEGLQHYNLGYAEYEKNKNEFETQKNNLTAAKEKYNTGLREYNSGLKKYNEGVAEYTKGLEEYNSQKNETEQKINDARKQIENIEKAAFYISDREDNYEYSTYMSLCKSFENLSKSFPIIFFLVTVFVSLLSMARMAIENRTEIGTLKALGFTNKEIRIKYIVYSLFATLIGGILGGLIGNYALSYLCYLIFNDIYQVPVFETNLNLVAIIIGDLFAVIAIVGATLMVINNLLKQDATTLLRPISPQIGKKILLEKIKPLWNKISFNNKIMARNVFRYKRRVIMSLLGFVGCTSLLMSGYAIKDSMLKIIDKQFSQISDYDQIVNLDGDLEKNELDEIFNYNKVKKLVYVKTSLVEFQDNRVNFIIPNDEESFKSIFNLKDYKTGKILDLKRNEIIITTSLAENLDKKVGDELELFDSNNVAKKFKISAITENYVDIYIYMDKQTYIENIDKFFINCAFIKFDNLQNTESIITNLNENDHILTTVSVKTLKESFKNMLGAFDSIIVVLIVFSALLSFVVMYSLAYITLSERQREIATLKVLGYNQTEVDDYILKEQLNIVIIGIIIGIISGSAYSNILVKNIKFSQLYLVKQIEPLSYIKTASFIFGFAVIVGIGVHYMLKKLKMIEALKSVE